MFPERGKKLIFMITIRGDQRPRSSANPWLARGPGEGGNPRDDRSSIIVNRAGLARHLDIEAARVTDWCKDRLRIRDDHLREICRVYAVSENDFRLKSFADFAGNLGYKADDHKAGSVLSGAWRRLLANSSGYAEIMPTRPDPGAAMAARVGRLRYATARRKGEGSAMPEIVQGAPFWLRLTSPQRPDLRWAWAGRYVTLLNQDAGRDGFRAVLPCEANEPADWIVRYPDEPMLVLPTVPILRHEAPDEGVFAMVAVLTDHPLPADLDLALSREAAHGLALEPALEELAVWLAGEIACEQAVLATARYRVVRRTGRTRRRMRLPSVA